MKRIDRLMSFAAGCAVTLVLAWLTTSARAQAQSPSTVHVCKAADGVLRLVAPSAACPVGQTSVYLATAVGPAGWTEPPPEPGPPSKSFAAWLNDLQNRLRTLETAARAGALGGRVVAPFEVVDRSGKLIFKVDVEAVSLYNSAGKVASTIKASSDGGYIASISQNGDLVATVGARGTQAGLLVSEGGVNRINIGRQDTGAYSARFYGKSASAAVAAIGQSTQGTGAAFVATAEGGIRAILMVDNEHKGMVGVFNKSSTAMVANLTEGLSGGGLLNIYSSSGERMVAAGTTDGVGVVQAGPASFKSGFGVLGLPGSYIAGKR